MNNKFLAEVKKIIESNKKDIKKINKTIKNCYSIDDKQYINSVLDDCEAIILKNVNDLNSFNAKLKCLPKNVLKDTSKKITYLYMGYRQLEENIISVRDITNI